MSNRGKGSTAVKTVPLRGATALRRTHDLRAAKGVKAVPLVLALLMAVVMGGLGGQSPAYARPPEDMGVWRVQITFRTADVKDAGTDDDVQVQLNPSNSTWLDYGRNDFERSDSFTYDLVLDNVEHLSEITMLHIEKTGTNGWCIRSFELLINGRAIFSRDFGNSTCQWLDNDSDYSLSFTVPSAELRTHPLWMNYTQPFPPFVIPRAEMESRIESIVGNMLHGTRLYWGHIHGRAVEVSRQDSKTIHVDLDLAADVDFLSDPEIDVDFDIQLSCDKGEISMTVMNEKHNIDHHWLTDTLLWFSRVIWITLPEFLLPSVNNVLNGIQITLGLDKEFCPVITVDNDGSIRFSL